MTHEAWRVVCDRSVGADALTEGRRVSHELGDVRDTCEKVWRLIEEDAPELEDSYRAALHALDRIAQPLHQAVARLHVFGG